MTPEFLSQLKTEVSAGITAFETALDRLYQAALDVIGAGAPTIDPAANAGTDPVAGATPVADTGVQTNAAVQTDPAANAGTEAAPSPLALAVLELEAAKQHQSGDEAADAAAVAEAQAKVDALSIPPVA